MRLLLLTGLRLPLTAWILPSVPSVTSFATPRPFPVSILRTFRFTRLLSMMMSPENSFRSNALCSLVVLTLTSPSKPTFPGQCPCVLARGPPTLSTMDINRLTPYRSSSPGLSGFGSGVCHQEFRDLCDINQILRRFRATGVLPQCQGMVSMPCDSFLYGDFSELQNTLNGAKNVHDLATSAVLPSEGFTQDSSDSVQEEGGEKGTVNDGVKGDAQANPGADA